MKFDTTINFFKILFISTFFYCKSTKTVENKSEKNKIKSQSGQPKSDVFADIKRKIKKEDKNGISYLLSKINSRKELNIIKSKYGINDPKSGILHLWKKLSKEDKKCKYNKIPINELHPMNIKLIKQKIKSNDPDKSIYEYRNKFLCQMILDYKLTGVIDFLLSNKVYKQQDMPGFELLRKNDYELWNKFKKREKLQKEYEIKYKKQRFAENAFFDFNPGKDDITNLKMFKILKIFTFKNRGVSPVMMLFRKIDEPEYYVFCASSRLYPKKRGRRMLDYIKDYKEQYKHLKSDLNKNINSNLQEKNIEIEIDNKKIKVNDHFYTEYVKGKIGDLFDIIKKDLDEFLRFKKKNNKEGEYLNSDQKKIKINFHGICIGAIRAQLAGLELLRLLKEKENKKYLDIIKLRITPFSSGRAMDKNGYKVLHENDIEVIHTFAGKKEESKIITDPVPSVEIPGLDESPIRYLLTGQELYVIFPSTKLKVPSIEVLRGHPANTGISNFLGRFLIPEAVKIKIKKKIAKYLFKTNPSIAEPTSYIKTEDYTSLHYFKKFEKKYKHLLDNLENCKVKISDKK